LQECQDFTKQNLIERAHVTHQMRTRGHVALFGVKYHAELAWIERKWMELKRRIRRRLNGKLPTLRNLVLEAMSAYSVADARKAARHCRDTMNAYREIGSDPASLTKLRESEIKMKGHRRVFDASDGLLKLQSGMQLTVPQQIQAHKTAVARVNKAAKLVYEQRSKSEWAARVKRKARAHASTDNKAVNKLESKARKDKMLAVGIRPSKQLTVLSMFTKNTK